MARLLLVSLVGAALLVVEVTCGDALRAAAPDPVPDSPAQVAMPVGKWKVEFSNGVTEVSDIGNGGECSVVDPRWQSVGMAEVRGRSVVITYGQDRVERWTPVGRRCVVEHWYPASRLPTVTPVLGIAERAP